MDRFCLECGMPISGRREKRFCSRLHKSRWHNRERKARMDRLDAMESAFKKAGYELRRVSGDEGK